MTTTNEDQKAGEVQVYPLDDAAILAVAEWRQQQQVVNAILGYFARAHGLAGNWQVAENGRELVKQPGS
jgi:hypothetical protein